MTRLSYFGLILFPILFLGVGGCGGEPQPPGGTLSLKISFDGNPVPENSVVYVEGLGSAAKLERAADGTYVANDGDGNLRELPVGEYRVAVAPPAATPLTPEESEKLMLSGDPEPDLGAELRANFPVPEKFHSTSSSPVTVQIKEGENNQTVELVE